MASFYNDVGSNNAESTYKNTYYALQIALDDYLSDRLLQGDSTRIVESTTEYALIKRSGQNEWNNANLPFVNYKLTGKDTGGDRMWFSNEAYSQGIYIDEIRKKIRMVPVSFDVDCTYWSGRDDDWQYATDVMLFEKAAETKLSFYLDYDGTLVKDIAIINFNFDTSMRFTESNWLEQNNIHTFGINPTVQTFLFQANDKGFCIPKTVLIDFLTKKKIISTNEEIISYDSLLKLTIDHLNKTVTPVYT